LRLYGTSQKVRVPFPMRSLDFSIDLTLATLGSVHPLTEMSTRNLPGRKYRTARKADNITDICELSRKCGSLDFSQAYEYRPSRPLTGITLPFFEFLHFKSNVSETGSVTTIKREGTNDRTQTRPLEIASPQLGGGGDICWRFQWLDYTAFSDRIADNEWDMI
jgi:hypothetical protein